MAYKSASLPLAEKIVSVALAFALLLSSANAQEPENDDICVIAASLLQLKAAGNLPGIRPKDRLEEFIIEPIQTAVNKDWFKQMAPDVAGSQQAYIAAITTKGKDRKLKYLFRSEKPGELVSAYMYNGLIWDKVTLSDSIVIERDIHKKDNDGFNYLFNGKDLTGWNGDPKYWSASSGVLTGRARPGATVSRVNSFLIWTNGVVDDFELRLFFRFPIETSRAFGNSGIQYRSTILNPTNWLVGGYQADIEADTNYTGILYDQEHITSGRSIIAARGEKVVWSKDCKKQVVGSLCKSEEIQAVIKPFDWNEMTIIAQGSHLQHFINGKQAIDVIDECGGGIKSGALAIQIRADRGMTIQFKDIRIKTLK